MRYLCPLYSRDRSEAEIQADLYCKLKILGIEPRLEVVGYTSDVIPTKCLFDIVVFWPLNHKPICIIECKRGRSVCSRSHQKQRYSRFKLPLIYCFRHNEAEVVDQVRQLMCDDIENAPPSMRRPKHAQPISQNEALQPAGT